jgi:hypothetical protein
MTGPKPQRRIPKAAIYAVLSAVIDKDQARCLAGMETGERAARASLACREGYAMDVVEIRQRLSQMPGFASYLDTLVDLVDIRETAKEKGDQGIRLAANKQISKNQGYEAPLKMELEQRIKIAGAAQVIHQVVQNGFTPRAIREEKERRKKLKSAEFVEIEQKPQQEEKVAA